MGKKKEKTVEVVVAKDDNKPFTKEDAEKEAATAISELWENTEPTGGITTLRIRGARKNC